LAEENGWDLAFDVITAADVRLSGWHVEPGKAIWPSREPPSDVPVVGRPSLYPPNAS
jgi:hypothetical protein